MLPGDEAIEQTAYLLQELHDRQAEYQNDRPGTVTTSGRWIPSRFRFNGNA